LYNNGVSATDPCHLLFCDYEGDFPFSEILSKLGFLVDHIRPDALKHVTVGDHQAYIFSFKSDESSKQAILTCERLKLAELPTAIILLNMAAATPEFLNHSKSKCAADAYISNPPSVTPLLDALDSLVGCPIPSSMKGSLQLLQDEKERRASIEDYKTKIIELEGKMAELEGARKSSDSLRPKLQALLKGQKLQFQTETERLKYQLSEIEAQLLDREAKIKELEFAREKNKLKLEELTKTHEKSQTALREFYQNKIKEISDKPKE
jgi:hypothetical protein